MKRRKTEKQDVLCEIANFLAYHFTHFLMSEQCTDYVVRNIWHYADNTKSVFELLRKIIIFRIQQINTDFMCVEMYDSIVWTITLMSRNVHDKPVDTELIEKRWNEYYKVYVKNEVKTMVRRYCFYNVFSAMLYMKDTFLNKVYGLFSIENLETE